MFDFDWIVGILFLLFISITSLVLERLKKRKLQEERALSRIADLEREVKELSECVEYFEADVRRISHELNCAKDAEHSTTIDNMDDYSFYSVEKNKSNT